MPRKHRFPSFQSNWKRAHFAGMWGCAFVAMSLAFTGCSIAPMHAPLAEVPARGPVAPEVAADSPLQPAVPASGEGDGGVEGGYSPVAFFVPDEAIAKTTPPSVQGKAFIVVNPRSGKVLAERNAHLHLPVASTQKLLTALVLLDGGNLEQVVTVASSDTQVEPTTMGIRAGERYKRKDLLEAMMVRSSNDIAKCLARTSAGSEARFVAAMNAKARALGMQESHFMNSHGLSVPGSYSSAYDLSILARAAMNHPYLHRLTDTREADFRFASGKVEHLWNTNRVLTMSPYCTGLKTGFTEAAGRCLVACGERGGRRVITVILGSEVPAIWKDTVKLLHWALGVSGPA